MLWRKIKDHIFQHYMLQAPRIQNHVFSHDKENLKEKVEQEKEHDRQPNMSLDKSVMATVEQQPPPNQEAFKENSSIRFYNPLWKYITWSLNARYLEIWSPSLVLIHMLISHIIGMSKSKQVLCKKNPNKKLLCLKLSAWNSKSLQLES